MATVINLSWPANPASEGVIKYQVFESINNGAFNFKADVTSTSFQIANPAPGAYKWKVRAVNFVGNGADSNIAEGPTIPTQVGDLAVQVVNS